MEKVQELIAENWEDFLQVLKGVLEIPSVKGPAEKEAPFGKAPQEVLTHVLKLGQDYGFKTKNIQNAMGFVEWGPATSEYIGILGHLDVVAAGKGWSFPPFALSEKEGRYYGRGILDNKGPLMSCFYALKLLKDAGFQPKKRIRIIFGTDEESGMSDLPYYLAEEKPPIFGFTPDCKYPVVYGERGVVRLAIQTPLPAHDLAQLGNFSGEQGLAFVPDKLATTFAGKKIAVTGKRAPSNAPELGENAITLLGEALLNKALPESLAQYFSWLVKSFAAKHFGEGLNLALEDEDSGKLILTPVLLKKNSEDITLTVSFRYPVSFTEEEVVAGVKKALMPGSSVILLSSMKSLKVDKNQPEIKKLSKVYEEVTGLDGTPVTTTGATYARKMPHTVAFGPSFPGQKGIAHNQDEYMDVTDLKKNMEIYLKSIMALIGTEN